MIQRSSRERENTAARTHERAHIHAAAQQRVVTMPFSPGPRAKGSKGKKKDSVVWAAETALAPEQQQQQQQQGEEMAPFSSNGITASPYSSNNSGAAEKMRTLDMDPEAVSHVSRGGGTGQSECLQ